MSDGDPLLPKEEPDPRFRPALTPLSILPTSLSPLLAASLSPPPRSPHRHPSMVTPDLEAAGTNYGSKQGDIETFSFTLSHELGNEQSERASK